MREGEAVMPLTAILDTLRKAGLGRQAGHHLTPQQKAIQWVKNNRMFNGGIRATHYNGNVATEEVTGYLIPTLYEWGERELAKDLAKWEASVQRPDGAFSGVDGVPYTFDTAQVIRGFLAVLDEMPEVEANLRRACDYVESQIAADGKVLTPSYALWKLSDGSMLSENGNLYVLPPLLQAGHKLSESRYADAAKRGLEYFKRNPDLVEFKSKLGELSHYFGYMMEALVDLGEVELAKRGLDQAAAIQKTNGAIPAYPGVNWVCTPGMAQLAIAWYKLGLATPANKAVAYLEQIQNRSGGFYGSYGKSAVYLQKKEIAWAVKFFLDASLLRLRVRNQPSMSCTEQANAARTRVCTLHPNLDLTATEDGDLVGVGPFSNPRRPRLPHSLFSDYQTPTVRICRRILHNVNTRRWVPTALAKLPLRLTEREIVETLLAWDPDRIVAPGVRWLGDLQKLLRRNQISLPCTSSAAAGTNELRPWRRYDVSSRVSIVLPTYNGVKYLRQSIESCLSQTHKNIELIIVDDGSREDIQAIVDEYADPRIIFIRHERNRGVSEALNSGFRRSTGEYLSWTSDDNFYDERAIETMVQYLQTYSQIDFVYADCYVIDERKSDQGWRVRRNSPPNRLGIYNGFGACYLYRRRVYESVGEFNPKAFLAEDYDYWVRVWKRFRMQRLFAPLYYYRYHADSLTSTYSPDEVLEQLKFVRQINQTEG
jgi:GT2 family glycosyltransferase/tetratricopeptide (TPR) repeat protein